MTTEIIIPNDLWEEDSEAVITAWLASEGNEVQAGEVIAEIMVQKIQYEVQSPANGVLSIIKDVDDVVDKGDVIGQLA